MNNNSDPRELQFKPAPISINSRDSLDKPRAFPPCEVCVPEKVSGSKTQGYIPLLKNNRNFRNLWYGQVVSELGDWLNSIAIYALIIKFGGQGMAMALAMVAKLAPMVFVSPIAGVVIDRFDRKSVMIVSDILRSLTVLGLLWVMAEGSLVWVYILVTLETILSGFFEPARQAIIPSLTPKENLVTANALSGSTWSVMLAFGAALGGVVVGLFGIRLAFILDAITFLLSAFFIMRIACPVSETGSTEQADSVPKGWSGIKQGMVYLVKKPRILSLSLLKSGLAIAGGVMTLIPLYGHQMFSNPSKASLAIGWMYSARGLGAALGPMIVRNLFGESKRVMEKSIAFSFFMGAGFYFLYAQAGQLWEAALYIGLSTLFGSIIWVFSTSLIHQEVQNDYLGRVFSWELGILTLVMGFSNLGIGISTDQWGMTPNQSAYWMSIFYLVPGTLWILFLWRNKRQESSN